MVIMLWRFSIYPLMSRMLVYVIFQNFPMTPYGRGECCRSCKENGIRRKELTFRRSNVTSFT